MSSWASQEGRSSPSVFLLHPQPVSRHPRLRWGSTYLELTKILDTGLWLWDCYNTLVRFVFPNPVLFKWAALSFMLNKQTALGSEVLICWLDPALLESHPKIHLSASGWLPERTALFWEFKGWLENHLHSSTDQNDLKKTSTGQLSEACICSVKC